jgi:4-amino-4-deoxy-L-arabinose transferase-like glycosyltransferase
LAASATSAFTGVCRRNWTVLLAVGVVAGVALRVGLYRSHVMGLDSDEGVWGLMARHVLHGEISAFYWGQGHGGTQEVLLTSVLFAVFGSSTIAMRIVPVLLSAIAALLVWRVGRRTVGEPAARIAAVVFWIFPAYVVWKTEHAHGFYGSGLVYASAILLLALRVEDRGSRRDVALFGLVLGLALWQTLQIVPIAVAALGWVTWRRWRVWRDAWLAVPGFAVGALPWLLSNLQHGWWSFAADSGNTPFLSRLHYALAGTLPMALGLRVPFTTQWVLGRVGEVAYVAICALFVVAAVRARTTPRSLLFVVAASFPLISTLSPQTYLTAESRYVVVLAPVIALLLAAPLRNLRRGLAGLAIALALTVFALGRFDTWQAHAQSKASADLPSDFRPLIRTLDRLQLDRVFAGYWVAYRLDFETNERVIAAEADLRAVTDRHGQLLPPTPLRSQDSRHPAYFSIVVSAKRFGYVFQSVYDQPRLRQLFAQHGFARVHSGSFVVYAPPR